MPFHQVSPVRRELPLRVLVTSALPLTGCWPGEIEVWPSPAGEGIHHPLSKATATDLRCPSNKKAKLSRSTKSKTRHSPGCSQRIRDQGRFSCDLCSLHFRRVNLRRWCSFPKAVEEAENTLLPLLGSSFKRQAGRFQHHQLPTARQVFIEGHTIAT